jgi:hypothetical protein
MPARDQIHTAARQAYGNTVVEPIFHGTPACANARSIAQSGWDVNRIGSNVGSAYGKGFYTARSFSTARGYAGASGSVIVCKGLVGNSARTGNSSTTATSLAALQPPCHSVDVGDILVLFTSCMSTTSSTSAMRARRRTSRERGWRRSGSRSRTHWR